MTDIDRTTEKLAEVYVLVGPLYRRVLHEVEGMAPENRVSAGVRAVLDQLRRHGPMTVPEIGRSQSLSRQFVQRMVDEALAAGLVERIDNPRHRRSKLVAATAAGRAVIDDVVGREHARLRAVAERLPAADVDATLRVLAAMVADLAEIETRWRALTPSAP